MATPSAYPKLHNIRVYEPGRLQARYGSARINSAALDQLIIHSLRRLNDSVPGAALAWTRVVGAGTKLYTGQTTFTAAKTGYSGNPLALIPFRPPQSPESWLYIADSAQATKVDVSGTVRGTGIQPPLSAPTTVFGAPSVKIIDALTAAGTWANSGTAGAITASTTDRMNTTIAAILYDSGTTGWASIVPTALADIGAGSLVTVNLGGGTAETVEVQGIFYGVGTTTIGSINYDSGATGLCTIQPATLAASPSTTVKGGTVVVQQTQVAMTRGSVIRLNSGGGTDEYVIIQSVTYGPNRQASIRCSTVNNHTAGESLTPQFSFRAYCASNHAAAETLKAGDFSFQVTVGTGTISNTAAYDLSIISTRPLQDDDEFHLSLLVDTLSRLTEVRVMFDIAPTTHDFAHNALYYAVRPNDLQSAVDGTLTQLTARQGALQNLQVDTADTRNLPISARQEVEGALDRARAAPPTGLPIVQRLGTPSNQTATGSSQWTEMHFKVSDLQRVGADNSRSLANVAAVGIRFVCTDTINVKAASLTVEGTYGPDVGSIGNDYLYRYRYRSLVTGAVSNLGPAQRSGLRAHRQSIVVTAAASSDAQVDLIDYYRYGGALPDWRWVGVSSNSSPTFTDPYDDTAIANAPLADFDDFRPFPTVDIPRSGVCNTVGTQVIWVSGDTFNTSWVPGSIITIGGIDHILYNFPSDTHHLEIVESGGTQSNAAFQLRQPTLDGQPLPCLWGPFYGMGLACGDLYQPGYLFFTKGNNWDSAPDTYQIEVSPPSEPLMNGCMYSGHSYVYSSERDFEIFSSSDANVLITQPIPGGDGMFSRWGLAVGRRIYKLTRTGISATTGGAPVSITDPDLTLLFPHDGQAGVPVTLGSATFQPPDFTQTAKLRLSYEDAHLKFTYLDVTGAYNTLVYSELLGTWGPDTYSYSAVYHYAEEGAGVHSNLIGGADGFVYQESGTQDNSADFTSEIRMAQVGNFDGYYHANDGFLGLLSNGTVNLVVNVDGTDYTVPIGTTGGTYQRTFAQLIAAKGLQWQWALTGTGAWTLWADDTFFHIKKWGADAPYDELKPFANLRRALVGG